MIFKTTKSQVDAIELLLRVLLNDNQPFNIAEQLVYSHVSKAYTKVRAKTETMFVGKATYSINLTDQEAWALYVFYENVLKDVVSYPYEILTLQSIINQIDHQYGKSIRTNYTNRGLAAGASQHRLGS